MPETCFSYNVCFATMHWSQEACIPFCQFLEIFLENAVFYNRFILGSVRPEDQLRGNELLKNLVSQTNSTNFRPAAVIIFPFQVIRFHA